MAASTSVEQPWSFGIYQSMVRKVVDRVLSSGCTQLVPVSSREIWDRPWVLPTKSVRNRPAVGWRFRKIAIEGEGSERQGGEGGPLMALVPSTQ